MRERRYFHKKEKRLLDTNEETFYGKLLVLGKDVY